MGCFYREGLLSSCGAVSCVLHCAHFSVEATKWQQQQQSLAPYLHSPLWSALADTITAYVATNPATSATPRPEGLKMSNTFKLL